MAQYTITRRIEIDAGHRVTYHDSKCRNLHGHRYVIEASVTGELHTSGSEEGMTMDFSFLKEEMTKHIHDVVDHAFMVWEKDPLERMLIETMTNIVSLPFVPTAENLAGYWFNELKPAIALRTDGHAELSQIKVWETPNCAAVYPC
jgi:6-pyruvoyltetrahydropterin/6-carboxytetrahydropterin synthase